MLLLLGVKDTYLMVGIPKKKGELNILLQKKLQKA